MHVQVAHPDGEAKFWIEPEIAPASSLGSHRDRSRTPRILFVITSRRFAMRGSATSVAEVTHVSRLGFWVLLGGEELHVAFADFPWFRAATIEQITTLEWPTADHLYWPLLDVDVAVSSIRTPTNFPLVSPVPTSE